MVPSGGTSVLGGCVEIGWRSRAGLRARRRAAGGRLDHGAAWLTPNGVDVVVHEPDWRQTGGREAGRAVSHRVRVDPDRETHRVQTVAASCS